MKHYDQKGNYSLKVFVDLVRTRDSLSLEAHTEALNARNREKQFYSVAGFKFYRTP